MDTFSPSGQSVDGARHLQPQSESGVPQSQEGRRQGGRRAGHHMSSLSLGDDCGQSSAGAASQRGVCREGDL